jgi:dipeptidyl-peptidase-4
MDSSHTTAFPIEEVARIPAPGLAVPSTFAFSPDDRLLTFLNSPEGTLVNLLFALDVRTGQRTLLVTPGELNSAEDQFSRAEALRRERLRQLGLGVTQYAWADSGALLIPLQGSLFGKADLQAPLLKILDGERNGPILAPQLSPDGKSVAFVKEGELYIVPFEGGDPQQLTSGAHPPVITHGLAEYIAEEEMDRHLGFWWSPDSRWIAFAEVDATDIPIYPIVHQGMDVTGTGAIEEHAYPFAGKANARVRLGVIPVTGGEPVWMDLGSDQDIYLARVQWCPEGSLTAQIEDRRQTHLKLLRFDLRSGGSEVLLEETSQTWINLHHMLYPLKKGGFIWASERSGYRHLYLYDGRGNFIRPITQGEWIVDSLAGVDEQNGQVYFTGSLESPTTCQLYAAPLEGRTPKQITSEPGMHSVVIDHACRLFVDTCSSLTHPPQVTLRSLSEGAIVQEIELRPDPRLDTISLPPPEMVTLLNRNGDRLYGAIYHPDESFGKGPFPTVVYVYGGPHTQLVVDDWRLTAAMRPQYLRSLGFLVFALDNRGSSRRGLAFEGAVKFSMGHPEVDDQVDGVRWLVAQGLVDPQRVAVYGWSYGGYMAAMCLARAADTFKVAVAGAPVTDWDGYDTHYTERYMGMPQENQAAYVESSVKAHVQDMQGKLLLVHGLIDENVHFRHTARLINALIKARKRYQLLLFPDERHSPRSLADRIFMEENIRDFLVENL